MATELVTCRGAVHRIEWRGNDATMLDHGDDLAERVLDALCARAPTEPNECRLRVAAWTETGLADIASMITATEEPSQRWLCFDAHEMALWDVAGVSRRYVVQWGPRIGHVRVLRALEIGVPADYVEALAAAGADRDEAVFWFATGTSAGHASRARKRGARPHVVPLRALPPEAEGGLTRREMVLATRSTVAGRSPTGTVAIATVTPQLVSKEHS
jgi:hypothetical protein